MKNLLNFLEQKFENINWDFAIKILIVLYFVGGIIISLISNGYPDEYLYLLETSVIADLFREGKWIGADLTGTHGFLFKIPVAVFFLIFGKSLFIARVFNIYLACLFILFLYKFGKKHFESGFWSFLFVLLTITSYQFVRSVPTYLRDIPSLLSLLWFFYYLTENRQISLKHGMLLLLLLDAKEYVAVILGFSILVNYFIRLLNNRVNFKEFIYRLSLLAIPSVIYIFLMYFTNIIPYNDSMSKTFGMIKNTKSVDAVSFRSNDTPILRDAPDSSLSNGNIKLSIDSNNMIYNKLSDNLSSLFFWEYLTKLFSARTFTITSIPKIILIISLAGLYRSLKENSKCTELYATFTIIYLIIYFLRATVERYILGISPLIFLFFVKELINTSIDDKNKNILYLLVFSFSLTTFGFIFDNFILITKIFISILLFISMIIFFIFRSKRGLMVMASGLLLYSLVVVSLWVAGSYKFGVIHQYFHYGKNFEYDKIGKYVSSNHKYWYNGNIYYIHYITDTALGTRVDRLKYNFRKKHITNNYDNLIINFKPSKDFVDKINTYNIDRLLILETKEGPFEFAYQDRIKNHLGKEDFEKVDEVSLQGKVLHIIKVKSL